MTRGLYRWDNMTARWYKNAALYNNLYGKLSEMILSELKEKPEICDVGCGIGTLALALAPNCRKVLAIDINPEPIEMLKAERPDNISTICDDFTILAPPETKLDAVVSCLYASPAEHYEVSSKWADKLFFIESSSAARSFSASQERKMTKTIRYKEDEDFLRSHGISFKQHFIDVPFGQPFEDRAEAELFMHRYDPQSTDSEICSYLDKTLVSIDKPPFKMYLPGERHLVMFEINACNVL